MTDTVYKRLRMAAALLTLVAITAWVTRLNRTGLGLNVTAADGSPLATYTHSGFGAGRINALLARGERLSRAEWNGYWIVPSPGFVELVLKSDGETTVELDGTVMLGIGSDASPGRRVLRSLPPGPHRLRVRYQPSDAPFSHREVFLKGVTPDGVSVPVERGSTSPREPSAFDRAMAVGVRVAPMPALGLWLAWLVSLMHQVDRARYLRPMAAAALCAVTILAAALRFEAVVVRYWGVEAPDWAEALATDIRAVRPSAFEHAPTTTPYSGDPFSYLTIARSMGGFYEPSAREPLFPKLTQWALWFAGGRDIGLNFLSALASTLTCAAIFALGLRLSSPWSGLAASLLWAIDWQVISFSVEGWRDDVFCLEVVACVALLLSLHAAPLRRWSILLGLMGGLTLLTRLSALTFLIPGVAAAVLLPSPASRRKRLGAAGVALLGMALLAGPFMASCALGFGDPLYAVNVHAAFYRNRAGLEGRGGLTALQFLAQSALPWEFLETGVVGLTSYPFLNKWSGLEAWLPGLGDLARLLAVAGLPVLLWRARGLLALLALFGSILPYAWTWGIPGGSEWRFTLPAYPFYLLSAAVALEAGIRQIAEIAKREPRSPFLGATLRYAATATLMIVLWIWGFRQLDWLRVAEAIRHGRSALVEVGPRSGHFFISGWRFVHNRDGSEVVELNSSQAVLRLPVDSTTPVHLVLRLGASENPTSPVRVYAGSSPLALLSGPRGRGAAVPLDVPSGSGQRDGVLELRFVASDVPASSPLTLLWVRVEPWSPPGLQ